MSSTELHTGALLKHGEYRIIRTLGQGGFGITYEAEQVSLGRKVAVKEFFMKDSCERDESTSHVTVPTASNRELVTKFKDKFIREARMLAGFKHQHIVKVHDVFEENGTAYYVMEYLEGGSLQGIVRKSGRLKEEDAIRYINEVGGALSYIHSKDTLHLDVKPGNIMLDNDGGAVLIDFGISKHFDSEGHLTSSTPIGISKGYAPLEQVAQESSDKYSPATDIYSLGATLYFLLTGKQPYDASSILKGLPTDELEEAGVSPKTINAISCAMNVDMADRPQSVKEFLNLLDGKAEGDDEDTILSGAKSAEKKADDKQHNPVQNTGKPQNAKETKVTKLFPKWILGAVAGVMVAVAVVLLWPKIVRSGNGDNPQVDSTVVVDEAIPQEPVTGKPSASASASASKPETPSKPEAPAAIELKSISLNKTTLELEEGSTATLTVKYSPSNATDKTTTWKSTDASIAKVSTNGKVTAVKAGSAAIIVNCQGKDAYCNVTVKAREVLPSKPEQSAQQTSSSSSSVSQTAQQASATTGTHAGHEWVDLGLSVKWATCNVGASSPEGYGSYFAWAETSPKSEYSWSSLKYNKGNTFEGSYSKYVTESRYGTVDNKTRLELSDDAAYINWGGSWRMPTKSELQELKDKCSWTWTTKGAHNGYKVTSKVNANSIFLPAAGSCDFVYFYGVGSRGCYWSSSLEDGITHTPSFLHFSSDNGVDNIFGHDRCSGLSVRPVLK